MKKEFDTLYGSDEKDINNWFKLCHVLRIDPVPNTLKECRAVSAPLREPFHFFHFSSRVVLQKHVNLVDLVQGSRENIQIFKSEEELSNYTHETEKFFPKERAKDGGVLRALRRRILEPRESPSSQGQWPQPGNSYHHRLVESIQFEGSNSFQELRSGGTWGLGPVIPYHIILATCLQVQLAHRLNTSLLCSSLLTQHYLSQHYNQSHDSRSSFQVTSHIDDLPLNS